MWMAARYPGSPASAARVRPEAATALERQASRTSDCAQGEGPDQRKGLWMGLPRVNLTSRLFLKPLSD